MPAATIADVCERLHQAEQMLADPANWKRADELIDEARNLLGPISSRSPRLLIAKTYLAEIQPLIAPGTSDFDSTIDNAKAFVALSIKALCAEAEE